MQRIAIDLPVRSHVINVILQAAPTEYPPRIMMDENHIRQRFTHPRR